MFSRLVIKLICALIGIHLFLAHTIPVSGFSKTYKHTRELLSRMKDLSGNRDVLATLFAVGDVRIADLIQALDDPNEEISLRSQIVIRYLGNQSGMKSLIEWYGRRQPYRISGPVPLPLTDWDYKEIDLGFVTKPPQRWDGRAESYIYALALDGSPRAKAVLAELARIMKDQKEYYESTISGRAINQILTSEPTALLLDQKDFAKRVLESAFFVSLLDRQYTSARLLGFNGAKDKALIEVHINRGILAEEWYHVVINKREGGWSFFSIRQVAIS